MSELRFFCCSQRRSDVHPPLSSYCALFGFVWLFYVYYVRVIGITFDVCLMMYFGLSGVTFVSVLRFWYDVYYNYICLLAELLFCLIQRSRRVCWSLVISILSYY